MTTNIDWDSVNSHQVLEVVMPGIEANLQEVASTWDRFDAHTVPRLEPELQPVVMALLNQHDDRQMAGDDLLLGIRDELGHFLDQALDQGVVLEDIIMGPIVQRFGAALVSIADAMDELAAAGQELTSEVLVDQVEDIVDRITDDPKRLTHELDAEVQELVNRAVDRAEDPDVVRDYLTDHLSGARDHLVAHAESFVDAAAWLEDRLAGLRPRD
jgi:hypothetical protein